MNNEKKPFPWFFFSEIIQIILLTLLPVLIGIAYLEINLLSKVVPIFLLSISLGIYLSYRISKPFKEIILLTKKLKEDLPFRDQLNIFYKKNDWINLEETLKFANSRLSSQSDLFKDEKEKLLLILESISESIVAIDPYESILFLNSNFQENFQNKGPFKGIIKKIWHYFDDQVLISSFKDCIARGEEKKIPDFKVQTTNNEIKIFQVSITPLRDSKGMIKGALGFFYDTTAEINTQRMRVDFIANISHEIKTPLTSLLGYSQMLQAMNLEKDPQTEKILGKIVKNSEKINLLFTDLLNLSVIENKLSLIKKEIGLKEIIENSFEIVKKIYPEKCVALDLHLERDLILADEDLFGQIFNNLFDNSIKYSNEKEIIVTIKSLSENDHVKIIFSDNGPGIRTEDSDKIFQRFYRSHSKKHTIPGVGLGLSIVKQIIQKHGGNIRVSKANPSLEFEINIPNI